MEKTGASLYQWLWLLLLTLNLCACAPAGFESRMADMSREIAPSESAAVSWIYEESSGNVDDLGNSWRDRVERGLKDNQVNVKPRKDIGVIIDDVETFGLGVAEHKIWEQAGADVVVTGNYRVSHLTTSGSKEPYINLTLKALRVDDSSLVKSINWQEKLDVNWARRAACVRGNAHQKDVEIVADSSVNPNSPLLTATLDRGANACYPTATAGWVNIYTDPGSYVYILSLAADNSVTLLYPNSIMPEQPLPGGVMNFPPKAMARELQLVFYPLNDDETCREAIKVISSRLPIDFSYLPVPENTIYAGAQGGDIKQVANTLKKARGWSEQVLCYMVGPDCGR